MNFSKKLKESFFQQNSFAIYGLGITGRSVINFLRKKRADNFLIWDDNKTVRDFHRINKKYKEKHFEKILDVIDWIILSPGINIKKSRLKKKLIKNKHKIITDLDLFYILNPKIQSIVVTGSNGKSTTCKIIETVLKKNNIKVKLGGNIGKPILDLVVKKDSIIIIEASSFQLEYSQFISPSYAMILNITNDHLDWHITMKNYMDSKFKIFKNQQKNDFAFLNNKKLTNYYRKNNFKGKLIFVSVKNYQIVRKKIRNIYLKSTINDENMSFVYQLAKKFNINDRSFVRSVNFFKGLEHRHEIFLKKKDITFINDSKATSFEATKQALMSNKNIYWILGGLPKKKDYFHLKNFKKIIIKAYVIGKNSSFFIKQIRKNIPYTISRNMKNAINNIYKDIKVDGNSKKTILLSPAAASFDQYKNFENRGNYFKKLIMGKFKRS
ncbi:UDP-N-acetylmuramoyl-L-alanine--D-glutamate ligase [Pelagibacteraceae bacterium]|nr:UDP-N-acetylmuramoyl-L-alanine--D-glutamate ligase [Pelagibacteraceae bacterium]